MAGLAAFRQTQLRFLSPYTQLRSISTSVWALAIENSARSSPEPEEQHSSPSLPPLPPQPAPPSSLIPSAKTGFLPALTEIAASALHRLVVLVTNLRRVSANESYVRRVLQTQIGISPVDLDLLSLHHPEVFRLSVRHNIEPVVAYLRTQGLTGSALSHLISRAPGVLSLSVEDDVMPLCTFFKDLLGNRGMGVLLRHPPLAEVSVQALKMSVDELKAAELNLDELSWFILKYPEHLKTLSTNLQALKQRNRRIISKSMEVVELGATTAAIESVQSQIREDLLQLANAVKMLKGGGGIGGFSAGIAEVELQQAVKSIEKKVTMTAP